MEDICERLLARPDATVLDAVAVRLIKHLSAKVVALEAALKPFIEAIDNGRPPHLEDYDKARTALGLTEWECPRGDHTCKKNCGSYGCGN